MAVLVCRTCPRDGSEPGSFGDAVRALSSGAALRVLYVNCLGACEQPGNAALDGVGKARIRFSGLSATQFADVHDAAAAYEASSTGHPREWDVPARLRPAISAVAVKRSPR